MSFEYFPAYRHKIGPALQRYSVQMDNIVNMKKLQIRDFICVSHPPNIGECPKSRIYYNRLPSKSHTSAMPHVLSLASL